MSLVERLRAVNTACVFDLTPRREEKEGTGGKEGNESRREENVVSCGALDFLNLRCFSGCCCSLSRTYTFWWQQAVPTKRDLTTCVRRDSRTPHSTHKLLGTTTP